MAWDLGMGGDHGGTVLSSRRAWTRVSCGQSQGQSHRRRQGPGQRRGNGPGQWWSPRLSQGQSPGQYQSQSSG